MSERIHLHCIWGLVHTDLGCGVSKGVGNATVGKMCCVTSCFYMHMYVRWHVCVHYMLSTLVCLHRSTQLGFVNAEPLPAVHGGALQQTIVAPPAYLHPSSHAVKYTLRIFFFCAFCSYWPYTHILLPHFFPHSATHP